MMQSKTYFLGTAIEKRKDPRAGRCECGEPAIGYIRVYHGSVEIIGFLQKRDARLTNQIPMCRTHYLGVEEKEFPSEVTLKG